MNIYRFIFLLILTGFYLNTMGQKTDKIRLKNGDIITGEIMSMKLGMLTYKTDGAGTLGVKWEEVTAVISDKVFEFMLRDGIISVSSLDTLFHTYKLTSLDDIVEIIPIKDRFLKRLSGDVNLGFNYTKSNQILQSNFGGTIGYKIPKIEFILKLNSVLTNYGKDTSFSKKQDVVFNGLKSLSKKFFWGGSLGWQQNSELGLENRYLTSLVLGVEPITDNHNRMLLSGGFSYNQEQSVETGQYTGNFDALFAAGYKRFYYSSPKLSIDANYSIYPGLSDWGRIRMQADLYINVEIFKDFLMGLTSYYSYDNRPPEGSLSNNDYGIMFTIGYKFGK